MDEEFALTIRMLPALAFVPPNDDIHSFDTLADYSRNAGFPQLLETLRIS